MHIDLKKYRVGIKCLHCKDEIYSMHRHDCVECECKKVSIDGGDDYMKTTFEKPTDYTIIHKKREKEKKKC